MEWPASIGSPLAMRKFGQEATACFGIPPDARVSPHANRSTTARIGVRPQGRVTGGVTRQPHDDWLRSGVIVKVDQCASVVGAPTPVSVPCAASDAFVMSTTTFPAAIARLFANAPRYRS